MEQNLEVKEFANFPGLKEVAQKFKGPVAPPVEQKVEQPASPVEPKVISDPGTEVVKQSETVADVPKEQPKAEVPVAEKALEVPIAWDAESSEEQAKTETPTFDFSKLGSALKLEGVKSESDLVAKFSELQTKLQTEETKKAATFEGIPDDLKEVIDLAKNGGDWKSYMGASAVDWSKEHPLDIYEYEFSKLPHFRNPDGTINQQAIDDALDAIPEGQKMYEGSQIINQRIQQQQQLKNQQVQQARLRKEQNDKALIEATKNLSEILPESQYGVKFEAKHSDYLFKGISSGELLQKHFLADNGQYDMKKVAKTIALAEYGDKMIKFQAEKAKVAAKKEILNTTQNVQLETPRTSVAPDDASTKQLSAADRMKKFVETQRGVGHL
jgi:hypothetical protein